MLIKIMRLAPDAHVGGLQKPIGSLGSKRVTVKKRFNFKNCSSVVMAKYDWSPRVYI